jgi:uncharacterized RmlC-like cupin family protein
MNIRKSVVAATLLVAVVAGGALAKQDSGRERLTPADIEALPTTGTSAGTSGVGGIQTRILAGDPTAAGPYTIALRVPPNTQIQAHTHRDDRSAVVVSGTWHFGYGDKAARALEKALGPGSFYSEPANVTHFARTGPEPVVLYISGHGPTDTHYVDQKSDPRGKQ